jgi:hypothetical protein
MSNKFLTFVESTGKTVVHVVEEAPRVVDALGHLLADGVTMEPGVKAAIQSVMTAGEAVVLAGGGAAASEGENLGLDVATIAAVRAFIRAFLIAYPLLMTAASQGIADVKTVVDAPAA